ncbi:uncharacterized protein LOC116178478 [Photinus pyralis]|uniref:uncharacterized protein LOC116178478 n=1 Tax=Photinus pyralis TaxID=7054 RepID=UPI0012676634|nr:uncharacterized protein LOC116178478 [Photinus pyralis]
MTTTTSSTATTNTTTSPMATMESSGTTLTSSTQEPISHAVHTVFSIETYDTTKNFDRWLMRLESAFSVFGVPRNKQAPYLLHYMGPDAYDVLCDKLSPEVPVQKTYEELVNYMKTHYNPEPLEIAEIFRFLQRRQHEGESTQDFLTSLQKLATKCNYGTYLKKALRNQFVFGLRNQAIQSRLLEHKDLTVEKAVEVAKSMEVSQRDAAQLHNAHRGTVQSITPAYKNSKFSKSGNFVWR